MTMQFIVGVVHDVRVKERLETANPKQLRGHDNNAPAHKELASATRVPIVFPWPELGACLCCCIASLQTARASRN